MAFEYIQLVVPINTALSNIARLDGQVLVGVIMPADWDAADLTFRAGKSEDTLQNLHVDTSDTEVTVQAAADRHISLSSPEAFSGVEYLQVRSGTSALPVNQTAARTLTLLARDWKG